MANTYTLPAVLPSPDEFAIGQDVTAAGVDLIRDVVNQTLGHGQAGPLWCQAYPSGDWTHTGAVASKCMRWLIPHITDSHTTITVGVTCSNPAGNATFTWTASNTGATAVVNTGVTVGQQTFTATLTIGAGVQVSEVTLDVATGGSTVDVSEMFAWVDPLASPLAGGPMVAQWGSRDGVPLGQLAYGTADNPLTAARGRDVFESLRHMLARPQCVLAWSGVDGITSATVYPGMQEIVRRGVFTPAGDGASGGGGYVDARGRRTVRLDWYVYAIEAASPTVVYPQIGMGATSQRWQLTIPAGGGTAAWHTIQTYTQAFRAFDSVVVPTVPFGLWPDPAGRAGRTTADVRSLTVIAR